MWSHGVPDSLDTPVLIPNEGGGEMGPRGTMKGKMTLVPWLVFPHLLARVSQFIIYYHLIFHQIRS